MVCLQTVLDNKHWSSENTNAPPIATSHTSVYRKGDVMESLNRVRKEKWLVTTIHQCVRKRKPCNVSTHSHDANNSFRNTTVNGWLVNSKWAFRISLMFFWLLRTTLENREFTTSWLNQTRGMEEALTIVQMYAVFILWPVPAGNRSF